MARPKSAAQKLEDSAKATDDAGMVAQVAPLEGTPAQVDDSAMPDMKPEQVKVAESDSKDDTSDDPSSDDGMRGAPDKTATHLAAVEVNPELKDAPSSVVPAQWDASDDDFLPAQSR